MSSPVERLGFPNFQVHNHPGGHEVYELITGRKAGVETKSGLEDPSSEFFTILGVGVLASLVLDRTHWKSRAITGLGLITAGQVIKDLQIEQTQVDRRLINLNETP